MSESFKLTVDGQEVVFSQKDLFTYILEKVHSSYKNRPECRNAEAYTEEIFKIISSDVLSNANFNQLFTIFFLSGFFYANFLEKNEVQITEEKEE